MSAQLIAAKTAVTEAWDAERPETGDPEFWVKTAACEERLADAYRALMPLVDECVLRMALVDAEGHRRSQAKVAREHAAAETSAAGVSS